MANPRGQQRDKPFRDALRMEALALANGEQNNHPVGSLRSLAQALLMKGAGQDVPAIKEVADRLDGKVPQAVVGDDEHDAIRVDDVSGNEAARRVAFLLRKAVDE